MQKEPRLHASWQELLAAPVAASHIVQIYDRDDFVASGVALFAAEGLKRGEAVLLTGTQEHLRAIRREMAAKGAEPDAAIGRGQLAVLDVHDALRQGIPDETLARSRADDRFAGVRWWGEMTNVLYQQGEKRAAVALEDLGSAAAAKHGATVFCSFLCDRFDPAGYDGVLKDMCCKHTHVIPAEDYVRHRLAVNRAIAEVVGEIRGPLLQSLLSWKGLACELPSSQAILFWIRDSMPERFQEVLQRVKAYQLDEPVES
jgi:hypothetical protein